MRVVLASERPQVQNLLMDVVEEEPGAVVVGQAENATKVLVSVKNLRPDVAIIDGNLPHSVGLDNVRLSRIGGWDTAQAICGMIPNTRVIIINNLDTQVLSKLGLSWDSRVFLSRKRIGGNTALKLQELCQEVMLPNAPVFADVEMELWTSPQPKSDEVAGGAIAFGTVSIGGGLYLIGTLWLAPYGVLLVLAGVVTVSFGMIRKLTARLWRKQR